MNRYELVNDDRIPLAANRTLTRIRALRDNPRYGIRAGELGGYIESADSLSQSGCAWIFPGATVYDNAYVCDSSAVKGNARLRGYSSIGGTAVIEDEAELLDCANVFGAARISGRARLSGSVHVYGDAVVGGNVHIYSNVCIRGAARIVSDHDIFWASNVGSENGTLTAYMTKSGEIEFTRGCFVGTMSELLARSSKYSTPRVEREYALLAEVALSRIKS